MKDFSKNLRRIRKAHRLSQARMASLLEVSQQRYAKWEMGYSEPSIEMLIKIADTFGMSLDELIKGHRGGDYKYEEINLTVERLKYHMFNCTDKKEIEIIRKVINALTSSSITDDTEDNI